MLKWLLGGTVAQGAAFAMLFRTGSGAADITAFLALQIVAALLLAAAAWCMLPKAYRQPFAWSYGYLALLCFLIPGFGWLVCAGSLLAARVLPSLRSRDGIAQITLPQFVTHLLTRVRHGSGGHLRAQLGNAQAPISKRMTALVAMQSVPARMATPVLRNLLGDPVDDVRLLAYGMLDRAEKDLTRKILQELPRLEAAHTDSERYAVAKRLADLYWELIYQGLVQGDVYDYTAEQVERYASMALDIEPNNAALWYMRGRLAVTRHQFADADRYLERAEKQGFARERLVPAMAESAFLQRDFSRAASIMGSFSSHSPLPLLKPLLRYWNS
ncbi:lipopolysaccharide N-acetylglucosaminyl transferase [Imbroritus primus]|uniref:Lipopolysaccharide N-acetylglucosaminyl transferase n=1 Tax=Imbroritus primus TaxID=3058603 RepID=A0ACD3SQI3_9BURK|nr:lipopolysaccharide N-acetylglucosaminyl transferase [Burkholderiaceae bacterium PBA]